MKTISFPFERQRSAIFGTVYRPMARVDLWSALSRKWVGVDTLVDTGADYTVLPQHYALVLGIDLTRECQRVVSVGVGGSEPMYFLPQLPMRVGSWSRRIPVAFARHDAVPALLGRAGCLDTFDIRFARHRTTFRPLRPA